MALGELLGTCFRVNGPRRVTVRRPPPHDDPVQLLAPSAEPHAAMQVAAAFRLPSRSSSITSLKLRAKLLLVTLNLAVFTELLRLRLDAAVRPDSQPEPVHPIPHAPEWPVHLHAAVRLVLKLSSNVCDLTPAMPPNSLTVAHDVPVSRGLRDSEAPLQSRQVTSTRGVRMDPTALRALSHQNPHHRRPIQNQRPGMLALAVAQHFLPLRA
eukprot:3471188-Rhodomonas_salina.4